MTPDCRGLPQVMPSQCRECPRLADPDTKTPPPRWLSPDLQYIDRRWVCHSRNQEVKK